MESGYVKGNYEFLELIGKGGQGKVYKAFDTKLRRPVAIKVISLKSGDRRRNLGGFLYEARLASSLNHPNICTIYAMDEDVDHAFMVMEYVEGKNVFELAYQRPLEIESALRITLQVTSALIAAHGQGIIHRDIKPRNVMVSTTGQVRVLDFGLAELMEDQNGHIDIDADQIVSSDSDDAFPGDSVERFGVTMEGVAQGTPASSPPEMVLGKPTDQRSDIFSTGIVLYLLLTGTYAFAAKTKAEVRNKIINEDYPAVSVARRSAGSIPLSLIAIVVKALRKDPDERFQTAYEMHEALLSVLREVESDTDNEQKSGLPVFSEAGQLRYSATKTWEPASMAAFVISFVVFLLLSLVLAWYAFG